METILSSIGDGRLSWTCPIRPSRHWADFLGHFPKSLRFVLCGSERAHGLREILMKSKLRLCWALGISSRASKETSETSPPFCIKSTHNKHIQIIPLKLRNAKTFLFILCFAAPETVTDSRVKALVHKWLCVINRQKMNSVSFAQRSLISSDNKITCWWFDPHAVPKVQWSLIAFEFNSSCYSMRCCDKTVCAAKSLIRKLSDRCCDKLSEL